MIFTFTFKITLLTPHYAQKAGSRRPKNPRELKNKKNHCNAPTETGILSFPILTIRSWTRSLQLSWFCASTEGKYTHIFLYGHRNY